MKGILIVVGVIILLWLLFTRMERDTRKIYGEMSRILQAAKDTSNPVDLLALRKQLIDWHKAECWHRCHGDYARQVLNYIDGKLAGLSRQEAIS